MAEPRDFSHRIKTRVQRKYIYSDLVCPQILIESRVQFVVFGICFSASPRFLGSRQQPMYLTMKLAK